MTTANNRRPAALPSRPDWPVGRQIAANHTMVRSTRVAGRGHPASTHNGQEAFNCSLESKQQAGRKSVCGARSRVPLNTSQAAFKATYMRQIPVWATRRGTMDANIWGLNLIPKFVVHDKRFSGWIIWQVGAIFIISWRKASNQAFHPKPPNQITNVKHIMIMQTKPNKIFLILIVTNPITSSTFICQF